LSLCIVNSDVKSTAQTLKTQISIKMTGFCHKTCFFKVHESTIFPIWHFRLQKGAHEQPLCSSTPHWITCGIMSPKCGLSRKAARA